MHTALLCLIVTVVGLTALSEIGVNVAPLLAGAGIVGIAIGFGSQRNLGFAASAGGRLTPDRIFVAGRRSRGRSGFKS